jgi:hypothetical protein
MVRVGAHVVLVNVFTVYIMAASCMSMTFVLYAQMLRIPLFLNKLFKRSPLTKKYYNIKEQLTANVQICNLVRILTSFYLK